ncbi:MAG: MBL fold metallo-hydrolase [Lentisphaeria bacterium]
MNPVKLILLANNLVRRPGLLAEHGLAFWLDDGTHRLLFDTGQGLVLRHNAAALGLDLERVTDVVLSHGHYDHTGGLAHVAAMTTPASPRLWMLADAMAAPRFSRHQDGSMHDIAMPAPSREVLARFDRPTPPAAPGPVEVMPGVFATGPIPRVHAWEKTGGFFWDAAGREADDIPDDQALWLDTVEGVVVLLGCAHAGCLNTLERVRRQSGGRPLAAVVGGTHLSGADSARLAHTVAALRELAPAKLVPLHCTGDAVGILKHEFPATCRAWGVGDGTTFDR